MKRGLFVLLFLVVFILMVVVEYSGQDNQGFSSGSCPFMIPAEVGEENLEVIAQFDGVTILRVEENKGLYTRIGGYVVEENGRMYMINSSEACFFPWGFVTLSEGMKTLNTSFVIANLSQRRANVTLQNRTATLGVKHFVACGYGGEILWEHDSVPPYYWLIYRGKYMPNREGVSYPQVLTSNTSNYLFVVEVHSAPREVPFVRRWVGEDWVYVFGREGLVKKLSLEKDSWPKRNVFISSAGNYTILGFEQPQEDGSPAYGRVLIFNGSEVIFDKTFPYDPNCLCYVIPGWGRINEEGYATFGLYTGTGIYNGTLIYEKG